MNSGHRSQGVASNPNEGPESELRKRIRALTALWRQKGLPSRGELAQTAAELGAWREKAGIEGLCRPAPVMMTATLDDGIGQGLDMIQRYGAAVGVRCMCIGLVQTPAVILAECRRQRPDLLGLTVIHVDAEDDLQEICRGLPGSTRLIAGGPAFRSDPDLAARVGLPTTARHVGDFLDFLCAHCGTERG